MLLEEPAAVERRRIMYEREQMAKAKVKRRDSASTFKAELLDKHITPNQYVHNALVLEPSEYEQQKKLMV